MTKCEPKTTATPVSVAEFIAALPDPRRRGEAGVVDGIHRRVTGLEPKLWGSTKSG